MRARLYSVTLLMTAKSADVARRSCSAAPLIPEVGMSRARCHFSSATVASPRLSEGHGIASSGHLQAVWLLICSKPDEVTVGTAPSVNKRMVQGRPAPE